MEMKLNGPWKVTSLPFGEDLSPLLDENFSPEGWIDAEIPEDIHVTLRRAGVLRGATYGKLPEEERWVEESDWVYHREFFVPEEPEETVVTLEFQGLDTFCEIYLNGEKIGSHANMFTPLSLSVKDRLVYGGRNVLLLRFYSPVKFVEGMDDSKIFSITDSDRILARKAQMNYSWDFCGRCVTTGIWKEVSLSSRHTGRISSYYLRTQALEQNSAQVALDVELEALPGENPGDYEVEITLAEGGQEVVSLCCPVDKAQGLLLTVENPKLWWPRPYGPQNLYDFTLVLKKEGEIIETLSQQLGIRTIEVLQEDRADGRSFQFAVNGKKLFIRGANWVPMNAIYTEITARDYEARLEDAVGGNLSMLRIWGGGIYEPPLFFDLCAQKGILVWSDFMFSCGIYPQTEDFLEQVREEGEWAVRQYRNATALAIWSGDNEDGQAYGWAGRPYEFREDRITRVVLKELCARLDPSRFYLATSPDSPDPTIPGGDNPSSTYQGDAHIYIMSANPGERGHRDYGKNYYKRILSFRPRFMSEFGFISLPERDTFYRFNFRREPLRKPDELSEHIPLAGAYLKAGDFDRAIYYSQNFQSMALKYWIEYFRSLKGTCSGCLYWKFNDPLTDSPADWLFPSHMCAVDMYGNTKMAYYYTRRAYADSLISFIETDDGWNIFGVTEKDRPLSGTLTITQKTFGGKILAERKFSARIPGDSAALLAHISREEFAPKNPASEYLKAELQGENEVLENSYFFLDVNRSNELNLQEAQVSIGEKRREGRALVLRLSAPSFLRNLRLFVPGHRVFYSDNYFDMEAGATKEIILTPAPQEDLSAAAVYVQAENTKRICIPLCSFR